MAKWYKIPMTIRVTEKEYDANIRGMNIVFGAVLGFVLAGAEGLPPLDFMIVLFVSAMVAISILYLGTSEYRLFYFVTTVALIALLPVLLERAADIGLIPYLQPTLAVWAFMVVLLELLPREKRSAETAKERKQ